MVIRSGGRFYEPVGEHHPSPLWRQALICQWPNHRYIRVRLLAGSSSPRMDSYPTHCLSNDVFSIFWYLQGRCRSCLWPIHSLAPVLSRPRQGKNLESLSDPTNKSPSIPSSPSYSHSSTMRYLLYISYTRSSSTHLALGLVSR